MSSAAVAEYNRLRSAATFMAVLAHPADPKKQDRFFQAVRAYFVAGRRQTGRLGFGSAPAGKRAPKGTAIMKQRDIEREWNRAGRYTSQRLSADQVARTLILERTVKGGKASVRKDVIEHVLSTTEQPRPPWPSFDGDEPPTDNTNFYARVWLPSKPVLHLAAEVWSQLAQGRPPRLEFFIFEPDWIDGALQALPTRARMLVDAGIVTADELIDLGNA